jgi:hypothetical protein
LFEPVGHEYIFQYPLLPALGSPRWQASNMPMASWLTPRRGSRVGGEVPAPPTLLSSLNWLDG